MCVCVCLGVCACVLCVYVSGCWFGGGGGGASKNTPLNAPPQVVAVVNGREKADFLRRLGVDAVVDASSLAPAGGGDKGQPLHKAIKAVAPKGETLLNWRHHTFEWRYVCAP